MTIVVDTVSTNFTAFTMQRVHRIRHQVYEENDFEIQSMTSLVTAAKQKTCVSLREDSTVHLPLHSLTERVHENLRHMHHHLSKLLAQKLGPDARHIIAAERARQSLAEKSRFAESPIHRHHHEVEIAEHLSELGKNVGDELELLVEYRELYAAVLADLLIVKENLVRIEKDLESQVDGPLKKHLTNEIQQLE
jgi:hypothetical protein